MRRALFPLALVCLSSGCNVVEQPSGLIAQWTTAWRRVATNDDSARLRDWRKSFENALGAARKAGYSDEIARQGPLLDPDSALVGPTIPNGLYGCRVIKLGAKDPGNLAYVAYAGFTCRVRAQSALQRLSKLSGSQRYVGLIFPNDSIRNVYLGTLVLGDERRALQYGQDEMRDVAGFVERIGPDRWRLIMPQPHFESRLDVMELVPLSKGAPR